MSLPAIVFKGLLKILAGQFIEKRETCAECIGEDFGSQINLNAKQFFSISLIEVDLPADLAAVGVLCDDSVSCLKRKSYTFFIYIDSSKKFSAITEDLKTIISKLIISHETCHFAFYYELFLSLGADLSNTLYDQFQHIVSGKLDDAITNEANITNQTVVEEHSYRELVLNFGYYPNTHYAKKNPTGLDYNSLFLNFFGYLTQK